MIRAVTVFCGSSEAVDKKYFIKPEFLDLWYPAPDVDALVRYLDAYRPHAYGPKWGA
jgi:hypothetical protein